jgi:hypothetical protein
MLSSQTSETPSERDVILESLIDFVTADGVAIPITLQVGGLLISGLLISEELYFKHAFVSLEHKKSTFPKLSELSQSSPPAFIYLADTRITSGGSTIPQGEYGVYWRGKLEAVDGFFLRNLVPE